GWGISQADRNALSYHLSVDQSPFFDAKPIYRKEVNEAENLAENVSAGFELQILCEHERTFLIEVTAENGQTWIIEM
ncbi:MAG: glycosyl transferase family 2, partial [Enterococcus thailandicus]|nr:glycosyl transferase family 2 [Enterococcus thailandicus]